MEAENVTPDQISVFIVDDHPAIVEALSVFINSQPDMEVCGRAYTTQAALDLLPKCKPDVAITDILLSDGHGLHLLKQLRGRCPETRFIVFSMCEEAALAERAISAGAYGYVMKSRPTEGVIEAIRAAFTGGIYLSRPVASRMLNKIVERDNPDHRFPLEALTDNEILTFEMLGHSYSIRAIASCLGVSNETALSYRRHVQKKLGAENTASLLRDAYTWASRGVLSPKGE
jgi:DNA-binding NarL/FixJ family response regulator